MKGGTYTKLVSSLSPVRKYFAICTSHLNFFAQVQLNITKLKITFHQSCQMDTYMCSHVTGVYQTRRLTTK